MRQPPAWPSTWTMQGWPALQTRSWQDGRRPMAVRWAAESSWKSLESSRAVWPRVSWVRRTRAGALAVVWVAVFVWLTGESSGIETGSQEGGVERGGRGGLGGLGGGEQKITTETQRRREEGIGGRGMRKREG